MVCHAQRKNKYYRAEDFDGAAFKSELQEWRGKRVFFMPSFVQCTFIYINNDHILTKNLPRAGKRQNTVSFGVQTLDVPKMRKSCEKDKCFSFHGNNLFNGVLSSGQGPVQPHRREAKNSNKPKTIALEMRGRLFFTQETNGCIRLKSQVIVGLDHEQ